jgi:hypothetical protein
MFIALFSDKSSPKSLQKQNIFNGLSWLSAVPNLKNKCGFQDGAITPFLNGWGDCAL